MKNHPSLISAFALTAALSLLSPAARGQFAAEKAQAKTASTAKAGLTDADRKLIMVAAESDEAEIAAAKIALAKTSNPKLKEYAETMIADHTKSTAKLKPIAEAGGIAMPELMPEHKATAAELQSLSGKAFDKAYLKGNVKSHNEVLTKMGALKKSIANPELKMFVAEMTPVIEHHLMMAKAM